MRHRASPNQTAPYRRSTNITGRADDRPKHPEKVFHRPACHKTRRATRRQPLLIFVVCYSGSFTGALGTRKPVASVPYTSTVM